MHAPHGLFPIPLSVRFPGLSLSRQQELVVGIDKNRLPKMEKTINSSRRFLIYLQPKVKKYQQKNIEIVVGFCFFLPMS